MGPPLYECFTEFSRILVIVSTRKEILFDSDVKVKRMMYRIKFDLINRFPANEKNALRKERHC